MKDRATWSRIYSLTKDILDLLQRTCHVSQIVRPVAAAEEIAMLLNNTNQIG
jgi:hypothetical protein